MAAGLAMFAMAATAKASVVALRWADGGGAGLRRPLALVALLYQDALLALGFAACAGLAAFIGRRFADSRHLLVFVCLPIYAVAATYTAVNVGVARVLSTPLTRQLLAGAGGAIADSIATYVTGPTVAATVLVLAVAVAAPLLLSRFGTRARGARLAAGAALVGLVAAGPWAEQRVETLGLHRNAIVTLLATSWQASRGAPRPAIVGSARTATAAEGEARDLSFLAGMARGRSVIVVALESTAAMYLGLYGARGPDPTPNLTSLGENGLVFDHAYTSYPESIKGLWSVLCGVSVGVHTMAENYAAKTLPCASLAQAFKAAGYRTGMFHSGRFVYLGMEHIVRARGFDQLCDAGCVGGPYESSFGTEDRATVDRILAFIDAGPPGAPFFVMYLPIAGHHPYSSPGPAVTSPFLGERSIDRYRADLFKGDLALGALIRGVQARALADRVLWAIYGDHGEAFLQHEANVAHSLELYEENVRVPLVLAAPGLFPPLRAPQIASAVDLAPTLLALLGMSLPTFEGRSLLEGQARVARFSTDWNRTLLGLREGRWKVIHDPDAGRTRLFNLEADPAEMRDLAGVETARTRRHVADLEHWSAERRAFVKGAR